MANNIFVIVTCNFEKCKSHNLIKLKISSSLELARTRKYIIPVKGTEYATKTGIAITHTQIASNVTEC